MSSSLLDEPLVVTPLTKAMRRIPIDADEQWRRIFVSFLMWSGFISFVAELLEIGVGCLFPAQVYDLGK